MFGKLAAGCHLSRAEKLFSAEKYDLARKEFDRATELDNRSSAVHLRYAVFLSETNDPVSAISHVERALEVRPSSAPYHLFYGRILFDCGRYKDAAEQFEAAGRQNPKSQLIKNYAALLKVVDEHIEEGLKELEDSGLSQNSAFHGRALVVLEKLVRFNGRHMRRRVLVVDEDNQPSGCFFRNWRARGYLSDGINLLDLRKWDEAVKKFKKARALAPDLLEAAFQEGVAYYMAEDYPPAEEILRGMLDEGDEPSLYYAGAVAEQGRYEESLEVLEKIVHHTPEYHYYVGLYLLSVGQDREALYHFVKAAGKRHDLLQRTFERITEIYKDNN
jgi:tetratricopeptide (TPR) repeat protein